MLDLGIRSITAETRDGEHLVIPNAVLVGSTVTNYTLSHSALRVHAVLGVVCGSDMAQVRSTLEAVARRLNDAWGVPERRPSVFMTEFGDHAV